MKRRYLLTVGFAASAIMLASVFTSCASSPKASPETAQTEKAAAETKAQTEKAEKAEKADIAAAQNANNVSVSPTKMVILDWANRSAGEDSVPVWLKPLVKGNSARFKEEYGIPADHVVGVTPIQNKSRNTAMTVANVQSAAKIANELKRAVLSEMGASQSEDGWESINDAATTAKVSVSGMHEAATFWQQIETQNIETGDKTREFIVWYIYDFAPDTWNQLVAKYLYDVVGKVADTKAKQKIGSMLNELKADAKNKEERENELSDREYQAQLAAQQQAAADLQAQKMAGIGAAKDIAESNAKANWAAYRSGDPAVAAAASTTASDIDWIQALSTAANIIF